MGAEENSMYRKLTKPPTKLLPVFLLLLMLATMNVSAAIPTTQITLKSSSCDGVNDEVQINKALLDIHNKGGGVVYLSGNFVIDNTIKIYPNTKLTGDSSSVIKLANNAKWSTYVPMIRNAVAGSDFLITGFKIDGNQGGQSGIPLGKGYYNMIHFDKGCSNIEVSNMKLVNGNGDGVKIYSSKNIKLHDNEITNLGHDGFYILYSSEINVYNNKVLARTNSACRFTKCTSGKIYSNTFYSSSTGGTTGPLIELDDSNSYIEINNNKLSECRGSGIWMVTSTSGAKDVNIHHNTFTKVGQYSVNTGYSNAAVTLGNYQNTKIENNVINNGGQAGIKWFLRSSDTVIASSFKTITNGNSITNTPKTEWNTNTKYHAFV